MGTLKDLKDVGKRVYLLLSSSNLAEIYVYDALKKRCNATLESVLDVDSSSSFKNMLELVNIQPNLADDWLFVIKYNKVKGSLKKVMGIFQSTTSVFLLQVGNYKEFKEVKELLPFVTDLYLDSIRKDDVMDLLRPFGLSQSVKDFVSYSYYTEPEKVFSLRNELLGGAIVKTSKDVVKLCGESMGSIQTLVFQLLEDAPKTKAYFKRSYTKRVSTVTELCDTFNPKSAYNFIKASVKDVLDIKTLYMQGIIYNRIKGLPECYDEARLSKYNYKLKLITDTLSYERVLYLYNMLNSTGRWYSPEDGIAFLYKYYLGLLEEWNKGVA